ncbi:MAG: hypothetical protein PF505_06420 [Vallitaleaceae bacterium]|jgi:hypothetical protein|nr:hypothetical protein [Vallitaleaceae bacterium]
MYCNGCGKEIIGKVAFCGNCGKATGMLAQITPSVIIITEPKKLKQKNTILTNKIPTKEKKHRHRLRKCLKALGAIALSIPVVTLVFLLVWSLSDGNVNEVNSNEEIKQTDPKITIEKLIEEDVTLNE